MLSYIITEEDFLVNKFPNSKILQCRYDSINSGRIQIKFREHVKKCKAEYNKKQISIEQVNTYLYEVVDQLKEQFPNDFEPEGKLGWFSKNLLAELYMEGKVDLKGCNYLTLELEKREKKERLKREKEEQIELLYQLNLQKQIEKENSRQKVVVGMEFSNKYEIELAYKECKPMKLLKKDLQSFLDSYLIVERVRKEGTGMVWVVIEVKQEGGRKWV